MTDPDTTEILAEADRYDSQGNHDEAINVLARATQHGDLLAKTRLGKRLLVGDRAPYLPKEGAEFIMESAQSGIAEAICVVAVFQATGIYQQKSWPHALNTLGYAASLGSTIAREQILLLAEQEDLATEPGLIGNDDPDYWKQLATDIDIDNWLAVQPGQTLNDDPLIEAFPALLPPPVCSWLIRLSDSRLKPALVYDAENRRNYKSETRTNSIAEFNLVENELLHFMIQQKMSAACGIPMKQMEGTAILNYKPGEQISDHFDFVSPEMPNYEEEIRVNGQRIITFLIYLNDDYEGGETVFTKLGIRHKGTTGEGLYFVNAHPDGSSDLRTEHTGAPTTSGQKWIISQFIRNREVKYVL